MRKEIAFALVLVTAAAGGVWAKGGGSQNMAGCGLGSMVFKDPGMGPQILAATTNGSFYSQIFGITTGTSGCESQGWSVKRMQRERFVASNFRSLSRELAVGQGEFASALASVMGCKADAVPQFLSVAKEKHAVLFPAEGASPAGTLRALESTISADSGLSSACTL